MSAQEASVARHALVWSLAAQGIAIAPLFFFMPFWIPLVWLAIMLWRAQIYRGAWPFPNSKIKLLVAGLCVAGLVVSFPGVKGVEPLIGFLIISFVLKVVEMRRKADVLLVVFTGFFAVAAQFLFFQNILMALYGLLTCLVLLAAWVAVYCSRVISFRKLMKQSVQILLHSLPLMILLFVVLPRFGAFWQVPISKQNPRTGFSESMSPGSFSNLSKSSEPAFRVTFLTNAKGERNVPKPSQRYWRGLVLDEFDGRSWHYSRTWSQFQRNKQVTSQPSAWDVISTGTDQKIEYEILMEPHFQRWLFTLMVPERLTSTSLDTNFSHDYLAFTRVPLSSRAKYHVSSNLEYLAAPRQLGLYVLRRSLQLPDSFNPKTVALAQQWRDQGLSDKQIIEQALNMFRKNFFYTLQPPILGTHSSDEFLFSSRRGFCEHYSSSFTILMRAAGIPARVVVGYQGGEYNPLEDYFVVRQSDAHAWSEVWLEGEGWQRVDPTAAVAPSRVERGLSASLAESDRDLVGSGFSGQWYSNLQMRFDALSYSWHRWVLGYDADRQSEFLASLLGGKELWRIGLFALVCSVAILLGVFLWLVIRNRKAPLSPEQKVYRLLLKKMVRRGFEPEPSETPMMFIERVVLSRPQWKGELTNVVKILYAVFYQGRTGDTGKLRRIVLQLNLK